MEEPIVTSVETVINYIEHLSAILERLDQVIYILLIALGVSVALLVVYLLYKAVHNFMTY